MCRDLSISEPLDSTRFEKACMADLGYLLRLDAAQKIDVVLTARLDLELEGSRAIDHARDRLESDGDLVALVISSLADVENSQQLDHGDVDTGVRKVPTRTRSAAVTKSNFARIRVVERLHVALRLEYSRLWVLFGVVQEPP